MVNRITRMELSRAFGSRGLWLALGIGGAIALCQVAVDVLPYALTLDEYLQSDMPMKYPGWLYTLWLGGSQSNMFSFLYFLILPLLACLPFGDSFFTDAKGGFIQNVCIRASRGAYFRGKYLAAFLSGGVAVSLPLLLNFLVCALLLPGMRPQPAAFDSLIGENSTFAALFYGHPLLYVGLFLLILFVAGGFLATAALVCSYHTSYRFLVLVLPFILYLFVTSLFSLLGMDNWQPMNFLHPAYSAPVLLPLIVETVLLGSITLISFVGRGSRDDIY